MQRLGIVLCVLGVLWFAVGNAPEAAAQGIDPSGQTAYTTTGARAGGTTLTYGGTLKDGGVPANGQYDLQFTLYDEWGAYLAGPVCVDNVECQGGAFGVAVDFGAASVGGGGELEVEVRRGGSDRDCWGGGGYWRLGPRLRLDRTPRGLRSRPAQAGSADGEAFAVVDAKASTLTVGIWGILGSAVPFPFPEQAGVRGESDQLLGTGVLGISGQYVGVLGYSSSASQFGVFGRSDGAGGLGVGGYSSTGSGYGVFGRSDGVGGTGVWGWAAQSTGVGVRGSAPTDGWAGYFSGRGYFSDKVGIGTETPATALDVNGTARMTGVEMPTGAGAGKVLTSDASGNGTWQAAAGLVTAFNAGGGTTPTATTQFLSPTVTVTVAAGQKVLVIANQTFGTTATGGAASLDLYVGYRVSGSGATPTLLSSGMWDNRMPQDTRVPMGISGVITGLSAGTYEVGMAGDDGGDGNWNNNEWGYVSAVVLP